MYFKTDDDMMDQEVNTAEKDGTEYTVFYESTNWESKQDYSISYFPYDFCMVTLGVIDRNGDEVSKEDALGVFNVFEFANEEEQL